MQQQNEQAREGRDLSKHVVFVQRKKIPLIPFFKGGISYAESVTVPNVDITPL